MQKGALTPNQVKSPLKLELIPKMNLPALKGDVSCKRCIVYKVRSAGKLFNCGIYCHFFGSVADSNRPKTPPRKRVLGY
jgi:hypothetical protein